MQIRAWKEWEKEAAGQDYEFSNGTLHTPVSWVVLLIEFVYILNCQSTFIYMLSCVSPFHCMHALFAFATNLQCAQSVSTLKSESELN